eukprot:5698209-Prymnesium_polylepis.1
MHALGKYPRNVPISSTRRHSTGRWRSRVCQGTHPYARTAGPGRTLCRRRKAVSHTETGIPSLCVK